MPKLSFSLHEYDSVMTRLMRDIRIGLEKHDKILGQIRSRPVSHGGTIRQVTEPKIVDTPLQRVGAKFEISIAALEQTDTEKFIECITDSLGEFFTEQKKRVFELLSQTTEAVGNAIDAKGRNFWDTYIEMLETTEMYFDENGENHYKVYMNPETAKKVEETPATPEQRKRIEEIMESKKREFYARKRSRKLS